MRFIIGMVAVLLVWATSTGAQTVPGNCGMQLGGPVIFCDTFDNKNPGIPSRTGDLDPNVWGVSRLTNNINPGQGMFNAMPPVHIRKCDGTTPSVVSPNDIVVCNGQLREASNDNLYGTFEAGTVSVLAMYPKQPFDFAGRTGTVSFDVSNDSHGSHAAWPEFWMSDLPVPAPFVHGSGIGRPVPQNGFGLRFYGSAAASQWCVNNANNVRRWTVGSAVVIRNNLIDDQDAGGQITVTPLDCVTAPPDNSGVTNHIELQVSQNQIDVYATDAGTTAPLKHIAVIRNANLTLTRGLVWLEDVHYNADKEAAANGTLSQREHTFVWDNVAFDGPFTYRDFSYDALDDMSQFTNNSAVAGSVNLGKKSDANQSSSWDVLNIPAQPSAAAVRILFNFYHQDVPSTLNVTVNGHAHPTPWPYLDTVGYVERTFAVTIPITDLVPGTNVVQLGSNQAIVASNVNIVLVNVPGGVPVLPGSNNAYPGTTPPPPPPPRPTVAFSASPTSVTAGGNSTLSWASSNATSCISSGGWTGTRPISGSFVVSPLIATTYTLSCLGTGGISPSVNVTVVVNAPPPPPPPQKTCTITIAPFTVPEGQITTFSVPGTANCQ